MCRAIINLKTEIKQEIPLTTVLNAYQPQSPSHLYSFPTGPIYGPRLKWNPTFDGHGAPCDASFCGVGSVMPNAPFFRWHLSHAKNEAVATKRTHDCRCLTSEWLSVGKSSRFVLQAHFARSEMHVSNGSCERHNFLSERSNLSHRHVQK